MANSFFIYLWKFMIFIKDLDSPRIFILFFLRENKIRKKTLNVILYFGKDKWWKTKVRYVVRLLIKNVW